MCKSAVVALILHIALHGKIKSTGRHCKSDTSIYTEATLVSVSFVTEHALKQGDVGAGVAIALLHRDCVCVYPYPMCRWATVQKPCI